MIVFYHCVAVVSMYLVGSSTFLAHNSADRALDAIKKINPSISITSVKTRGGLIEILAQGRTIYATADGEWFLYGQLFNGATGELVSGAQVAQQAAAPKKQNSQQKIPAGDLSAVSGYSIQGGVKGAPKLFILSDPDCPFCKQLDGELKKLSVETHTLLFPIEELHPGSTDKAIGILCYYDKALALDSVFKGESLKATEECTERSAKPVLSAISTFAEHNGFTGTPVLIAEDGRVHQGFINAQQIKEWLAL